MSSSNTYNLSLTSGESFLTQIQWIQNSAPVDLTGYTVSSQIRVLPTDVTASLAFTSSIAIPYESGTVSISLAPSASATLTLPCYVYDVRITSGSTFSKTLLSGKVVVKRGVTR